MKALSAPNVGKFAVNIVHPVIPAVVTVPADVGTKPI